MNIDLENEHFLNIGKSITKSFTSVGKSMDKSMGGITDAVDDAADEMNSILKKMKNFIDKVTPFFEKIGNWFMSWDDAIKFMANPTKAMAIILTLTIPVLGQLAARFMLLGGSMDQPLLFLFSIPPLTIIPAFAIIFGYIKPIKNGSPWDNVVWLPLLANMIGTLLIGDNPMMYGAKFVLMFASFAIAYWYKSTLMCTEQGAAKTNKIIFDSLLSYVVVLLLSFTLPYLPFVGSFFRALQTILPRHELFFQALSVFFAYVGFNIYNGSFSKSCSQDFAKSDLFNIVMVSIFITVLTAFSPGDTTTMLMNIQNKLDSK